MRFLYLLFVIVAYSFSKPFEYMYMHFVVAQHIVCCSFNDFREDNESDGAEKKLNG